MIMKNIKRYIEENNIDKNEIAGKMDISINRLERLLNTPAKKVNCITYKLLCLALNVPADHFTK